MHVPRRTLDDQGVTLVETLVAIVILGIAGVAVLAGFQMSVTASDYHRKQTTGGSYARSYAEAIQQYLVETPSAWVPCVPAGTYDLGDLPASYVPSNWPDGYVASQIGSTPQVAYDGDPGAAGCSVDTAVLVRLEVRSQDNRGVETLDVVLQRPCGGVECTS
ncbi:type II secretion system protein [Nocardioides caeni]|uniref:Type II secretion system protein n=1 Tax=Nocardioides caeni TaxID=574700 RepID=A0A4S8NN03_9ACTN|nr:type II secretion system protein [Nocardioides caeni]